MAISESAQEVGGAPGLSARPGSLSAGRVTAGSADTRGRRLPGGVPGWVVAGAVYLGAAVAMWWRVWSGHPSSTMTCACGDPPSFVWYLEWPVYAISHGHNLFFASREHFPAGINLLDNTSVLALGVVLAPVTWLAGPVLSLNVALTAAPAAAGLSAYGVLRRGLGVRWPAAFLGGLMFGFSPFVLRNEALNHLQTSFVALVPLIFWACYELAVAQRGRWWGWGLALGLLVSVQFFIGTDILAITAITVAVALGLAVVAALSRPGVLAAKLPFAWRGFGLAGVVAGVLLAYPLWFSLAGPEHIKGANYFHPLGNGLLQVLLPLVPSHYQQVTLAREGYLGQAGVFQGHLGIPALVVLAVALVAVRRPLVKLCAAMTLTTVWLSLGATHIPLAKGGEPSWVILPLAAFSHLPVLNKLTPATFSLAALWFVAVAGALVVDHLWPHGSAGAARPVPEQAAGRGSARFWATLPNAEAGRVVAAVVTGAVLVVPWLFAWPLPYATRTVSSPAWATQVSARLPAHAVVLFYPFPSSYADQALVWQARAGLRYAVVGGRGIVTGRGNAADHGWTPGTPQGTLSALSVPWEPHYDNLRLPALPGQATILAFRRALRSWGVTNVVVTAGGRNPVHARQWLTLVLGTGPAHEGGVWVWNDVQKLIS